MGQNRCKRFSDKEKDYCSLLCTLKPRYSWPQSDARIIEWITESRACEQGQCSLVHNHVRYPATVPVTSTGSCLHLDKPLESVSNWSHTMLSHIREVTTAIGTLQSLHSVLIRVHSHNVIVQWMSMGWKGDS